MPKFSERLRTLREERELSQMDLSKFIGISKSSVNMYERGEREPGLETLEAIADYFNVDMDYLLGKSDFKNKHAWLCSVNNPHEGLQLLALHTPNNSSHKEQDSINIVKLAGRDGRYIEKRLTDEQLDALTTLIDQLPEADV